MEHYKKQFQSEHKNQLLHNHLHKKLSKLLNKFLSTSKKSLIIQSNNLLRSIFKIKKLSKFLILEK